MVGHLAYHRVGWGGREVKGKEYRRERRVERGSGCLLGGRGWRDGERNALKRRVEE